MSRDRRLVAWIAGLAVFVLLVYVLRDMLTPFIAGLAVAYFLDPVADRLARAGASRALSAVLILAVFFAAMAALIVVLYPLLQAQVVELASRVPDVIETIREAAAPLIERLQERLPKDLLLQFGDSAGDYAGKAVQWVTGLLGGVWSGGMAVFHVVSLLIVTPIVAFYMLRDWDRIVAHLNGLLPRDGADTIREQMRAIDRTIAAFVRGQASVCLVLAIYYAFALTLFGLDFGFLVGVGAGIISFIPYVGASVGLITGTAIAVAQFGEFAPVAIVAAIFIVGQVTESYVLSPRLVGDRVGLHPVWLIFALMAGGALFGFTGVLLGVPVAAVIGVLLRFGVGRYQQSGLFLGSDTPGDRR